MYSKNYYKQPLKLNREESLEYKIIEKDKEDEKTFFLIITLVVVFWIRQFTITGQVQLHNPLLEYKIARGYRISILQRHLD